MRLYQKTISCRKQSRLRHSCDGDSVGGNSGYNQGNERASQSIHQRTQESARTCETIHRILPKGNVTANPHGDRNYVCLEVDDHLGMRQIVISRRSKLHQTPKY